MTEEKKVKPIEEMSVEELKDEMARLDTLRRIAEQRQRACQQQVWRLEEEANLSRKLGKQVKIVDETASAEETGSADEG